jgi:hypothetical protein
MSKAKKVIGVCGRCDNVRELRESHLGIPKFAAKWLMRQKSAMPQMFGGTKGKSSITQDVSKRRYFCGECESAFGVGEKMFSEEFFNVSDPALIHKSYGPLLATFCASVVWRALIDLEYQGALVGRDAFVSDIERAKAIWKAFVRGDIATPGKHEMNLLPLSSAPGAIAASDYVSILGVDFISTREPDARESYAISKLGGWLIAGTVTPPSRRHMWLNTKIHPKGGSYGAAVYKFPPMLTRYLIESISDAHDRVRNQSRLPSGFVKKLERRRKRDPRR